MCIAIAVEDKNKIYFVFHLTFIKSKLLKLAQSLSLGLDNRHAEQFWKDLVMQLWKM